MTLDLSAIAGRLTELAETVTETDGGAGAAALASAFAGVNAVELNDRIASAKTSWLLARPVGPVQASVAAPPLNEDYTVVASDGSFILPDRHTPARFYVINIGKVVLRYGSAPTAELTTDPQMYVREDELFVPNAVRRIPVNGPVLGFKRAAEELRAVAEVALRQAGPVLALQDGTLILWALDSQPDFVVDWVLEPYLAAMTALRDAQVPVAAYISYPASSDVMNSLRVSICDYPDHGMNVNCDHCRSRIERGHTPACDVLPAVSDRYIFEAVARLRPGERSQTFASSSKILERYGSDFRVHFFYLHTGAEIARVEVPQWLAADLDLLAFTHAAIYEQCQLGRGYPSALQEAHELAVIRVEERRAVEALIEEALARHGVVLRRSAKEESKRGRFV